MEKKRRIILLICLGLFLCLSSPLWADPGLEALYKEHFDTLVTSVYPLFDVRFFPSGALEDSFSPLEEQRAQELFSVLGDYLDKDEDPHPYLIDARDYGTKAFAEGAFSIGTYAAGDDFPSLFPVIEPKFTPDGNDETIRLVLSKRAFDEEGVATAVAVAQFANLLKQFYDANHNSIVQFINGRNLSEEFLYIRDALMVQDSVIEFYLDASDKTLEGAEFFLADSFFRDQMDSVMMLGYGIDQRMMKFLDTRYQTLLSQQENFESFIDGLDQMIQGAEDNAPDPEQGSEFDLLIYRNRVATMWIFQGWYLALLPGRFPVYDAPEPIKMKLSALLRRWKGMEDDILASEAMLTQKRTEFVARIMEPADG
ncbi:hypothetical protein [Sediminispirochaeta bajacaliforniensis]|uniref:hypothetical protein n=1 Tax=Sediminispirochaeta bajacaliforniensis TaxID=148 RepID=UPI00036052DF|nr:hypothetical protein [Sediminispirochaeta bajacaliforniensis]